VPAARGAADQPPVGVDHRREAQPSQFEPRRGPAAGDPGRIARHRGAAWAGHRGESEFGLVHADVDAVSPGLRPGESWDPEVTRIVGATTGYEARAYNARGVSDTGRGIGIIMRGPNVDPIHDPRWGRTEESYGEDPYLVGEMAKGYLAGLHGDDPNYLMGACTLKHFAANSNETTRLSSSSNLDARNMHEYYLATFRTAVVEGRADGIMTAYNQINGIPAGTSPILKSIVRDAWGFDGFFSTDGQAATHWVEDQHYYRRSNRRSARPSRPAAAACCCRATSRRP
jgi:beta-glucosidase